MTIGHQYVCAVHHTILLQRHHTTAHLLAGAMEQYLAVRQEQDVVKHLKHLARGTAEVGLARKAVQMLTAS